jgi:TDG/mug DNA glycosylase family protein
VPRGKPIPDILAPDLRVLFCGINPGLRSAEIGHNFARPGNRFWPALHGAGFTPRRLDPSEDREMLRYGLGITNLVDRPSAAASELSADELRAGGRLGAWRTAFDRPRATSGLQPDRLAGAPVWLLPNPSGLNAHHQLPELIRLFSELRAFAQTAPPLAR